MHVRSARTLGSWCVVVSAVYAVLGQELPRKAAVGSLSKQPSVP